MSFLKTYNKQTLNEPGGVKAIVLASKWLKAFYNPRPGDLVTHEDGSGFGIMVAISNDECTVLWSVEPQWVLRFNPMAVDEDFWIPIRQPADEFSQDIPT